MTTPTNQPSKTDNFCSSKHPHEPAIKPQLDAEGRCLICGLLCQIDMLALQLAEANEKCDGFKLYYEQLGAICDSDKLAIMSLQQQLATALEANKNANALIGATAEECKTIVAKLEGQLATAIAERDSERAKLSSLKLKILTNHVAAICKCGGELTAVGCAHCNLREAVVLATDICNSKLFDENREAVESILDKSIKYKEHLDATTL